MTDVVATVADIEVASDEVEERLLAAAERPRRRHLALGLGDDVEAIGRDPAGPSLELETLDLIGERDQLSQLHVHHRETVAARIYPYVPLLRTGLVGFHRCDLEGQRRLRRGTRRRLSLTHCTQRRHGGDEGQQTS